MLCPSCHSTRPANYEPCPLCYAPSPLGDAFSSNAAVNNYMPQFMISPSMQGVDAYAAESTSKLLVPYVGPQPVPVVRTTDFPTIHTDDEVGPLIPGTPEEHQIHVLPMYTKPRPMIPRYRVISGLISFFVVIGLLCSGSIYLAQTTGRLAFLEQIVNPQFQSLPASPVVTLPTPTTQVFYSSNSIITSATTALVINSNGDPQIPSNKFVVGKPIYVTYSINAASAGVVTFQWYTNNLFFTSSQPQKIQKVSNGITISGYSAEIYSRPAQGKVELSWNGVLQVTLYFVVEPDTNS